MNMRELLLGMGMCLAALACGNAPGSTESDAGQTDAGQKDGGLLVDGGADAGTHDAGPATSRGAAARAIVADGGRLIDVRGASEFSGGHIEGARNLPVDTLSQHLGELEPRSEWVVVYCFSGGRSGKAAGILADAGFPQVYDLGAMSNW